MVRIGLISDTHMPERWKVLPECVFDLFANVDLILHSGDIGELWVLDQLGALAPVIAVHGNDETTEAQAALPYLQTLSISGYRLVLTHAHYQNPEQEMASRVNEWQPILERRRDFAKAHGASLCVFGHTHIPMAQKQDGVWLVNPGAIASGNPWQKQVIQTVAIMVLEKDAPPQVQHFNVATGTAYIPYFDGVGFKETAQQYQVSILTEELQPYREWMWRVLRPAAPELVKAAILSLAHECWSGEREGIHARDIVEQLVAIQAPKQIMDLLWEHPLFGQFVEV
jgi:uncharacterized protein